MQQRPLCELGKLQQPVWWIAQASHPRTTSGSCGIFASTWSRRPWIGLAAYGAAHCRCQESEACWLCLATAPAPRPRIAANRGSTGRQMVARVTGGARDGAVTA
jgi:hypothetical protein